MQYFHIFWKMFHYFALTVLNGGYLVLQLCYCRDGNWMFIVKMMQWKAACLHVRTCCSERWFCLLLPACSREDLLSFSSGPSKLLYNRLHQNITLLNLTSSDAPSTHLMCLYRTVHFPAAHRTQCPHPRHTFGSGHVFQLLASPANREPEERHSGRN